MDGETLRAVAAVLEGGLSRHRVAARFGVAPSTVINLVRRFQETGSVVPLKMGGHKPKAIAGEHHVFLVQRIRDREFTLRGLVAELSGRGLKVDYRSVWNFVHCEAPLSCWRFSSRLSQRARTSTRAVSSPQACSLESKIVQSHSLSWRPVNTLINKVLSQ